MLKTLLFLTLLFIFDISMCADVQSDVSWKINFKPKELKIDVVLTISNAKGKDIAKLQNMGMANNKIKISSKKAGENLEIYYSAPTDQQTFKETFKPVFSNDYFCGFGKHLLIFPELKNRKIKSYRIQLEFPDDWQVASYKGTGKCNFDFTEIKDARGVLICAGKFAVDEFALPNNNGTSTNFVLTIQGERKIDDRLYFNTMKKMIQAQKKYFGGNHPAPAQMISVHIMEKGTRPGIPGFNRRSPSFDSIIGLHTIDKPLDGFEFFGMLSHEHMHNWFPNVLQSSLGPWFMEGLNDYVAYGILYDCGIHNDKNFSDMLSKWYKEYQWCVKRKTTPLMPYRRGMIAAWIFDLEIQKATDGNKNLKNLILHLLNKTPKGKKVDRQQFISALKALIGEKADQLYMTLIESKEAIDLEKFLRTSRYSIQNERILIKPTEE